MGQLLLHSRTIKIAWQAWEREWERKRERQREREWERERGRERGRCSIDMLYSYSYSYSIQQGFMSCCGCSHTPYRPTSPALSSPPPATATNVLNISISNPIQWNSNNQIRLDAIFMARNFLKPKTVATPLLPPPPQSDL